MSDQELKPPIILLGNARSGTSMVQSFFDLVPGISGWFEPRTVWSYAAPGKRDDRLTEAHATPRVKRYIRKRFLTFQREHQGDTIMEKTPSNVLRAKYVHEIFPESKLIFLIREPLAQLSSAEFRWHNAITANHAWSRIKETPKTQLHHYSWRMLVDQFRKRVLRAKRISIWGIKYPRIWDDKRTISVEQLIAKQWSEGSRICREDCDEIERAKPGTVLYVRYEDIVDAPREHFLKMAAHVGIDAPEDVLQEIERRADKARAGKWKRLGRETIESIEPFIRDEMNFHGYSLPQDLPTDEEARKLNEQDAAALSQGGARSAGLERPPG